ncbi:MAG: bacterial Ig-like domain-containing protein [Bacilli bacterium]|nr:bacterial Ig-like domain-containing protein [Bacilli bacterium]
MKRKALLLIIPFAAAGLAGCERANPNPPGPTPDPQCESATVSITSAGGVTTIKPGQTLQLTAEVNISGCTFSWGSNDSTIATVDTNGLVTGVKAGDVVINYGSGSFNLKVDDDAPTPPVVSGLKEAYEAGFAKTSGATEPMTFSATVVAIRNCSGEYFIQDGEYGIDLYHPAEADVPKLVIGKKVKVTAALCNYKGLVETSGDIKVEADGDGVVPQPANVASKAALDALKTNVLANAQGVVIKKEVNTKNNDTTLTIAIAGENVPVFFKGGIVNDYTTFLNAATEGVTVVLNKVVVGDRDGRQLIVVDGSELTASEPTPTKEVKSLAIAGTATKTVYEEGEAYSAAGLSVVATYTDDTTETVTVAITPNKEKAALGDTSVTFSATFGGQTATKPVDVTVNAKPVPTGEITVDKEYSVGLAALGLDQKENGYYEGTNNGFSYKDIGTYNKPSMQFKSKSGTVSNIIPFSKTITKVTVKISKEAGNDATLDFCFGATAALGETIVLGSETSYPINAKGTFDVTPSAGAKYFSLASTNFASYVEELLFNFEGSEPQKELTTLTVKTQPSKLAYNEGESFNAAGLILHAVYSDSSEEDITSGWTISPAGALAPTDNKVTVSYGGKSVDVNITVTARELQSIVIDTQPSKVNYVEGESFDPAGMVVKANYNVGDPAVITNYTYSPDGALELSDDKVVVSYNGKTASVDITVSEAPEVLASKFTFTAKDAFEESGKTGASMAASGTIQGYEGDRGIQWNKNPGVVTISNFPSELVIKKIIVDASTNSTASDVIVSAKVGASDFGSAFTMEKANHVDVTFEGSASGSTITINTTASAAKSAYIKSVEIQWEKAEPAEPAVNGVTVSPKTASLDLTETTSVTLSAAVDAVGGAEETVTWSVVDADPAGCVTVDNGVVTAVAEGSAKVVATSTFNTEKSDYCEVSVLSEPAPQPELESISVDASKAKTTYTEGELVVKDGLVVTAHYTNGGEDKVLQAAEYSVSPSVALTTEDDTVTVTYEGKSDTYAITVNPQGEEKGTEDNPFTGAEALAYGQSLSSDETSDEAVWVRGTVTSFTEAFSTEFGNFSFKIDNTDFICFRMMNGSTSGKFTSVDDVQIGDTVLACGKVKNDSKYGVETTQGTSYIKTLTQEAQAITAKATEHGTVNLPTATALNRATYSFTVTPDSGYKVKSVAVSTGATVTESSGTYSFKVNGPTEVQVTFVDEGSVVVDPYEGNFYKVSTEGGAGGNSSYTGTYTYSKLNGIDWIVNGNTTLGDYVGLGGKGAIGDRYICSQTAFDNEVSVFSISTGAKQSEITVNSVTLKIYSSASDAASDKNAIESLTADYVDNGYISFEKPAESDWDGVYFRVIFNLTNSNTGSNKRMIVNGIKVEF